MALVVESTSTVTTNNAGSLTLPAPSGIQTGDLLILIASKYLDTAISSTGFTQSLNVPVDIASDTLERQLNLNLLYKVAVLADETAPNYTVNVGGGEAGGNACMLRVSGWSSGDPVFDFALAGAAPDISGGGSFGQSSLTVPRPAGQLLIQAHALNNTDGGTSIFSWNGYSITSSDSNPTWTEVIDAGATVNQSTDTATNHLAVAYAITTDTSDITAYAATLTETTGDNQCGYGRFLAAIVEPLSPTGDISHIAITPDIEAITTASVTITADLGMVDVEPTVESIIGKSSSDGTQWTNKSKADDQWTNKDK
jgi:hypothetical protein